MSCRDTKILITGANGFIGYHLYSYFFHQGYSVIACISRLKHNQSFYATKVFRSELPHASFEELIELEKPTFLLHCAGSTSVTDSLNHASVDFKKNVMLTHYILKTLKSFSPKTKFIFFSSAAVYGNPQKLPINLETKLAPISPYGQHKLLCEELCQEYFHEYQLNSVILRLFSVYGPDIKKQIFWDIYNKVKTSKELILSGTGEETRDFIHVYDLVKVVEKIIRASEFKANIYHVARGKSVSIHEIAQKIVLNMKASMPIHFTGISRPGDPHFWKVDPKSIGFFPDNRFISLDSGIRDFIKFVQEE